MHLTTRQHGVVVRVTDFKLAAPGSKPIVQGVFLSNSTNYQRTIKGFLETPLNVPVMRQAEKQT